MKKLKELVKCDYETEILGIQTDSRKVKVGDLFVCIHGLYFDRHHFISQAIEKGAVALIVDQGIKEESRVPIVMVENTNEALLDICKKFYEDPASKLRMIGVTGTDGKTTTATMIQKLFLPFLSTAYMGTNGCHYLNRQIPMDNTTPVPETLYDCLHSIVIEGGEAISLEVSSEALLHNRVGNLSFDAAVFTNITEDHLNIHKTMENYVLSKAKLFGLVKETGFCVLNRDDPYYDTILPYCRGKVVTYGSDPTSDFVISDIKQQEKVTFKIRYSGTEIQIESPYLGKYNVWNLTASFVLGVLFGFDIDKMKETIKRMEPITGRNEQLDFGQDYTIILDYAHTENALKNVLMMARDRKKSES